MFLDPDLATIIEEEWAALPDRFPILSPDVFVIMPNHVHFILWLNSVGVPLAGTLSPDNATNAVKQRAGTSPAPTLGKVVGAFKSRVAVRWLASLKQKKDQSLPGRIWQRNFYDHIIRDEAELNRIRQYILDNPLIWHDDPENPASTVRP